MRTKMPGCAAFVDELRSAFGVEEINNVMKRGLRPECRPEQRVFFREGEHVLGLRAPAPVVAVSGEQMVLNVPKEAA